MSKVCEIIIFKGRKKERRCGGLIIRYTRIGSDGKEIDVWMCQSCLRETTINE